MSERVADIRNCVWTTLDIADRGCPKEVETSSVKGQGPKHFLRYKYQGLVNSFFFSVFWHQNELTFNYLLHILKF